MKTLLIITLLTLSMQAKAGDNDTLVINKPQRVTVITGDSLQKIIVRGREGDAHYVYRNTIQLVDSNYTSTTTINKDRWDFGAISLGKKKSDGSYGDDIQFHMGLGFAAPTKADRQLDFSNFSSWEIFITFAEWNHYLNKRKRDHIAVGLGIDWRNYRMTGDRMFVRNDAERVELADYPEGARPKFSRIKVFSWTVSLNYYHRFARHLGLSIGPVLNLNSYASIKTRYKQDGSDHKTVEKNIGQRQVTVDYMAVLHTTPFNFYLKYSPMNVLKDGSPKFRSLTFGLCF